MARRSPTVLALGLGLTLAFLSGPRPASAGLILQLTPTNQTVDVGQAVDINVFVSQTATGPQVNAGNPLLTGAVAILYNNTAGVLTMASMNAGPAWDPPLSGDLTFSNATSTAQMTLTSLLGIGDLSSPLLLGTLHFTAAATGTSTVSVATQHPGVGIDFVTLNGDDVNPTNTATSVITVRAVPEPSTLALEALGLLTLLGAARRRSRPRAGA